MCSLGFAIRCAVSANLKMFARNRPLFQYFEKQGLRKSSLKSKLILASSHGPGLIKFPAIFSNFFSFFCIGNKKSSLFLQKSIQSGHPVGATKHPENLDHRSQNWPRNGWPKFYGGK